MPYRPEAELKRPDLKGEFLCGHCGKTFCHAASLNRHRLNFHGDDQQCLICNTQIAPNDTVRRHMQIHHAIPRVFTCGCCNWTFPDKKELHSHNNCMMKTGQPGEAKAIAISSRPPGSLSQHELRGEERTPTARSLKKKMTVSPKSEISPTMVNSIFAQAKPSSANAFQSILGLLGSTQTPNMMMPGTQHQIDWVSLFMNNPAFLPFIQQQQLAAANAVKQEKLSKSPEEYPGFEVSPSSSNSERASTSLSGNSLGSSNFNNNNYGATPVEEGEDEDAEVYIDVKNETNDDDFVTKSFARDLLIVRTDPSESSTSSGPESGIGSAGDDVFTPSPCSMTMRSKEGSPSGSGDERDPPSSSPLDVVNLLASPGNRKRKSVDDIASLLFKKKCLMG